MKNDRVRIMDNYYCLSKGDMYEWKYERANSYLRDKLPFVIKDIDYDVFLSHSILDADRIKKIHSLFNSCWGYKTYVDWIDNTYLKRKNVTKETAEKIRCAMKNSMVLIYAVSENSKNSRWMKWECGFLDGWKGKVAILPIYENDPDFFKESEFLMLYDYININEKGEPRLINPEGRATPLEEWVFSIDLNSYQYRYSNGGNSFDGIGASLLRDENFKL